MRYATALLGLGVLGLSGCVPQWLTPHPSPDRTAALPPEVLKADNIIAALNANAHSIQSLKSNRVDLTVTENAFNSINLEALMVAERPRNFRLMGKFMKNTMVDMGSNQQEFWWWISKADPPYLYHCSHSDFPRIQGRVQLPFQPDWVMEALGMTEFDPAKPYQVEHKGNTVQLVERTVSPAGKPVRKVTVMIYGQGKIQVTAHLLQDEKGGEVFSARVTQVQQDRATGAVFPRVVEMRWPAEKLQLKMTLNEVQVNAGLPPPGTGTLFVRPNLRDVPSVDLARGADTPTSRVRRAGATFYRNP